MTPLQSFKALMQEGQRFLFSRKQADRPFVIENFGQKVYLGPATPVDRGESIERTVKVRKAGSIGMTSERQPSSISWLDWPSAKELSMPEPGLFVIHLSDGSYGNKIFDTWLTYDLRPYLPAQPTSVAGPE